MVYAHSAGAVLLVNYLLESQAARKFHGIYLNAPLLHWDEDYGTLGNIALSGTPFMLETLKVPSKTIVVRGDEFAWSTTRSHSLYMYPVELTRTHRTAHITLGYIAATQRVHSKLKEKNQQGLQLLPGVPVCLAITMDDSLINATEAIERTTWFGPAHSEVKNLILEHGSHDMFRAPLLEEEQKALQHFGSFLAAVKQS